MKSKTFQLKNIRGDFFILFAMLIFGSNGLFLRFLPNIPTLVFLFAFQTVGFAGFFLLSLHKDVKKNPKRELLFLITLAFVALGGDLSYFSALRLTTIANAAIAHQMVSIFILFLAPLFLREKNKRYELIPVFVSLSGLILLYSRSLTFHNLTHFIGISLGLLSALFYALLIIHYRYLSGKNLSITTINLWRYGFSVIILFPLFFSSANVQVVSSNIISLALFGLLFAVIGSGIHNFGMSLTKSVHAAVIGQIEPVIATIYAFAFLKEIPSLGAIIGGILILGSSLWLTLKSRVPDLK